jgi:hypothetical protein
MDRYVYVLLEWTGLFVCCANYINQHCLSVIYRSNLCITFVNVLAFCTSIYWHTARIYIYIYIVHLEISADLYTRLQSLFHMNT